MKRNTKRHTQEEKDTEETYRTYIDIHRETYATDAHRETLQRGIQRDTEIYTKRDIHIKRQTHRETKRHIQRHTHIR